MRRCLFALLFYVLAQSGVAANLDIGLSADGTSMDPQYHNVAPNNGMAKHVFDTLIRNDPGQKLMTGAGVCTFAGRVGYNPGIKGGGTMGTVVALAGQVGGAKLADGFRRLRGKDFAVIVNTGDDHEVFGIAFSPDIDTMLYTLAEIASPKAGWEPAGETYALHDMLHRLGSEHRVRIGDRSLALPLLRTEAMREECSLTQITLGFCKTLGIEARVLPMSNDPVRTVVVTDDGHVSYHEYLTELECEPVVKGFLYAGADVARIPDEVLEALYAPDLEAIVLCPANPYHTIQPILAVQGMRELLRERGAPVIAVSPIVGDKALKGAAGKMMRELGHEVSVRRAALEYYRLIDGFVIDIVDAAAAADIRACAIEVAVAPTIMHSEQDRVALAQVVLDLAQVLRERKQAERSG